jgi:hypothetical protein
MIMKITVGLIVIALLGLFIISLGCIGLLSPVTSANDNLQGGQQYNYEIGIASTDRSLNELKNLEIVVNKVDLDKKYLTYSIDTNGKKTPKTTFIVEKTNNDNTVKIDSKIPIIQDIRPELPNLLLYPENFTDSGAHWTRVFNQSGNYLTDNGTVEYYVAGTSDFTNIGPKKISTKSGTFDCIGIKQMTNYSMKESLASKNGTTNSEIIGDFNGENWITPKNGILVSSSFDNHKVINVDLSETNKGIFGFEKMYREVSVELHLTTELTKISDN